MFLQKCFFETYFSLFQISSPPPLGTSAFPSTFGNRLSGRYQLAFHLSRPFFSQLAKADCCWERPDWPRRGRVFATPSAQSRARGYRRLPQFRRGQLPGCGWMQTKPALLNCGKDLCSPPEPGLGRPGGSGTACTTQGRCCCGVAGMGSVPADGNAFDLGVSGDALTAPTTPIQVTPAGPAAL